MRTSWTNVSMVASWSSSLSPTMLAILAFKSLRASFVVARTIAMDCCGDPEDIFWKKAFVGIQLGNWQRDPYSPKVKSLKLCIFIFSALCFSFPPKLLDVLNFEDNMKVQIIFYTESKAVTDMLLTGLSEKGSFCICKVSKYYQVRCF